jgi:hypothetical protein
MSIKDDIRKAERQQRREAIMQGMRQFIGTTAYHRYSVLFPFLLLTDGAKWFAEQCGAYWIFDIIGSIEHNVEGINTLPIVFYNFTQTEEGGGVFIAEKDMGIVIYSQTIEYTDLLLPTVDIWGEQTRRNGREYRVCLLPSEH